MYGVFEIVYFRLCTLLGGAKPHFLISIDRKAMCSLNWLRTGRERILSAIRGVQYSSVRHASDAVSGGVHISRLGSRGVVQVAGEDSISLLQDLITHDMVNCFSERQHTNYAHFLNVQGRILCDTLIHRSSNQTYLVECDVHIKDDLIAHIRKYRLRKKVDVADVSSEYDIVSVRGIDQLFVSLDEVVIYGIDPRVKDLGLRVVVSGGMDVRKLHPSAIESDEVEYHKLRCRLGVCEGIADVPPGKALPFESNVDYMNGISFGKGCYLGQELTARTHFTGVTRKRIVPLELTDKDASSLVLLPESVIISSQGKSAGKLRSRIDQFGLGLLRLSYINDALIVRDSNGKSIDLRSHQPHWWPSDNDRDVNTT